MIFHSFISSIHSSLGRFRRIWCSDIPFAPLFPQQSRQEDCPPHQSRSREDQISWHNIGCSKPPCQVHHMLVQSQSVYRTGHMSGTTCGKLLLQLSLPRLHALDLHIEGNPLLDQGLLALEQLGLQICKSPQPSKLKRWFLGNQPSHIFDHNSPDNRGHCLGKRPLRNSRPELGCSCCSSHIVCERFAHRRQNSQLEKRHHHNEGNPFHWVPSQSCCPCSPYRCDQTAFHNKLGSRSPLPDPF